MNKVQLLTLKTGVMLRLKRKPIPSADEEDFNVTVTHIVGRCMGSTRNEKGEETRVNFRVTEVAWDKDRPVFYKIGVAFGVYGPLAGGECRVDLRLDNIKSLQPIAD